MDINHKFRLEHSYIFPLVALVLLFFTSTMVLLGGHFTDAKSGDSSKNSTISAFFNCEPHDRSNITCYPSSTPVVSRLSLGESKVLYNVSSHEADYTKGHYGKALRFDTRLGEYVDIGEKNQFSLNKFSVSFWVKEPYWYQSNAPALAYTDSESRAGWTFESKDSGSSISFGVTTDNGTITSPRPVPLQKTQNSTYVNLVGTFDGSAVSLYRNGVLFDSVPYRGTYNAEPGVKLRLGLESYYNVRSWAGSIDDLRIYNRPLSESEINAIFNNSTGVRNGLVGYWPFDGSLDDKSGNNNGESRSEAVSMVFVPDGRLFFTEKKTGEIRIMQDDHVLQTPFAKLSGLYYGDHQGLLGITADPKFPINKYVYVYLTYRDEETGKPYNAVIRYTDDSNRGINATVLLSQIPADENGNYAGGALAFGPDEKLYVTVGMGPSPGESQKISSMLGKVLRVNRDGSIPSDNPFPNSPVFTFGHRNMFGIAFDNKGEGIVTENGDTHFDEINIIHKGGNYGFPNYQYPALSSIMTTQLDVPPVREYDRVIAPSQAIFYTGDQFPQLKGRFLIVSYNQGNLHAIKLDRIGTGPAYKVDELIVELNHDTPDNIVSVAQSPQGEIYYGGYNVYKMLSIKPLYSQITYPIAVNISSNLDIENMEVSGSQKAITMKLAYNNNKSSVSAVEDKTDLALAVPTNLIGRIQSISASPLQGQQNSTAKMDSPIRYALERSSNGQTVIPITLLRQENMLLTILGSREPPSGIYELAK